MLYISRKSFLYLLLEKYFFQNDYERHLLSLRKNRIFLEAFYKRFLFDIYVYFYTMSGKYLKEESMEK